MDLFSRPLTLRPFQKAFQIICQSIRRGSPVRDILAAVTPGGGKSTLPVILAAELIPSVVDGICWVAPRRSLQVQGELAFLKREFQQLLGHCHQIRISTNDANPSRGLAGYITTIQAVARDDAGVNLHEMTHRRYALVIDETHHIFQGGDWETAIAPLVRSARLRLYMTGSLSRHDRKRLSFVPYVTTPEGDVLDVSGETVGWAKLRYSMNQAIADRAVIRVQFNLGDAKAEWTDRRGKKQTINSFDEAEGCLSDAIYTAISTGYAYQLLDKAVSHWRRWREQARAAKLLIVSHSISAAKEYLQYLKEVQRMTAALATSDEAKDAERNINRFRSGGVDALVTVAMAYEGLDVPSITHVACLTHIRSYPWIEQMIARATRFDPDAGEWESQRAFIFAPDDPEMREIMDKINREQTEAASSIQDPHKEPGNNDGNDPKKREKKPPLGEVVPHNSGFHSERITDFGGDSIPPDIAQWIARQRAELGICISETDAYRLLTQFRLSPPESLSGTEAPIAYETVPASVREQQLRTAIERRCRAIDAASEQDWGTTNGRIFKQFGKLRKQMNVEELSCVWAWLNQIEGVLS